MRCLFGVLGWCTVFFFFSSRRRHTRFDCDWSSDVCSSDLGLASLEILKRPGAYDKIHATGKTLKTSLEEKLKRAGIPAQVIGEAPLFDVVRSEEHTSELQSQSNLVCRLLLEKKKTQKPQHH